MINLEFGFEPELLSLAGIGSFGQFGVPRFAAPPVGAEPIWG